MNAVEVWNNVLSGAFMMASSAAALVFYDYWRKTGERLFAIFAVAFAMFAVERLVLAFVSPSLEGRHWIFLARFGAFLLIIVGIIDKNRPSKGERPGASPRPT